MDCTEARRLLNQGVNPGSRPPRNPALGFHLARCETCRCYRHGRPSLASTADPAGHTGSSASDQGQPLPAGHRIRRSGWLLVLLLPLLAGAWLSGIAWRTERNLAALVVTTTLPPPSPTAIRPAVLPTFAGTGIPPTSPTANPSTTPTATATTVAPDPGGPMTILLLGSDRRPDQAGPARTDTLMLLRVDPEYQRIALLSLPRDLWVEIPGYGYNRINQAYLWGEINQDPRGGLGLARETIDRFLGIPIDYAATIDFQSFIGLIDALGGIIVHVDTELYDDRFPTMNYGYTVAHFTPGQHYMDGVTALTYSRIRHPDSDFMRIRRQQAVMIGIGERIRDRGFLHNLAEADRLTASMVGYVQTDMPQERMIGLIWAMRNFDVTLVERYWALPDMVSFGLGQDRYVEVPNYAAFAALARQFHDGH
jgi:polyisoprenyl-teichoic acid--peptidoglycan teichoic acid transferase